MNLEGPRAEAPLADRPLTDRWVMSRLHRCIGEVNRALEAYRFDEAANAAYHFTWHEYCDWYLELAKPALADKDSSQAAITRTTLIESFDTLLRLLHPFMPFITEELWQTIPHMGDSIMVQPYPVIDPTVLQEAIEEEILCLQQVVSTVRDMRGVHSKIHRKPSLFVSIADPKIQQTLGIHRRAIVALAGLSELRVDTDLEPPVHAAMGSLIFPGGSPADLWIDLAGVRDFDKETAQKEKRLKELAVQMGQDAKKLSTPEFVAKAPPEVLKKTTARHEECRAEHDKLSGELRRLRELAR
jgi:valyl-tRNA synthetase